MTVSREDYLKAIIEAESEGRTVIPALLAQWLEVSPPAVTKAVKRLREDGYVDANRDGTLKLTAKGREAAHRTALRHHLVERMLAEIFGMEWHQVHAEAERLEHVISPAVEAKLIEKLGKEGDCPHGNRVLPETPAQIRKRGLLPLSEAVEAKDYVVASLYERDFRLLEFLHKIGIGPRVPVRVLERNYDDTIQVLTPNGPVTLGSPAAGRVWVKPKSGDKPKHRKNK
ncbi:metal-dependent transcriptional regulator [Edaphobacter bradus]|uniref:metal-dependent transcriptional regulator n=1 Tax=Edaphobacter bradus TaxID=2259016 RepID=UPI0021E008C9|nr:metal-dependent transcriptional regulator [Edaphobacter bradus]